MIDNNHAEQCHIVHILGSLSAGGAQRSVLLLCKNKTLAHYRHSVVSILGARGDFLTEFQEAGIPIYSCPVRWPEDTPIPSYRINKAIRNQGWRTFEWRLAHLLKQINADLVNTHVTSSTYPQAYAVMQRLKLPWVWTLHGLYRSRGLEEPRWSDIIDLMDMNPSMLVGVSQSTLTDFEDGHFTLDSTKKRVVYNGIKAPGSRRMTASLREQWNIPSNAIVFGTAGRLIPLKRHDLLIQATKELINQNIELHLIIAGSGPLYEQMQKQIAGASLEKNVHLVGFQEIEILLADLDVFVLPSDTEACPNALLEALSSYLPCIGTRVGGIPEILMHGGGILIEKGALQELISAMQNMLDPAVRQRYSEQAHLVAQRFSLEETTHQYAEIYKTLLDEARAQ